MELDSAHFQAEDWRMESTKIIAEKSRLTFG